MQYCRVELVTTVKRKGIDPGSVEADADCCDFRVTYSSGSSHSMRSITGSTCFRMT